MEFLAARHIPVHVVSGADFVETALSMGAAAYLLEPVEREQLVEALRDRAQRPRSTRGPGARAAHRSGADGLHDAGDGLEATHEVRKNPSWQRLPITLTAKVMRDDHERCLDAGANDYLAKPLDIDMLLSLLRVWMPKA